ncbi:MAG: HAMP domain-containing protein [Acidobacteria bacterium]|nr:HAMP domain-containing protein [Acidobacteriota bacterium]
MDRAASPRAAGTTGRWARLTPARWPLARHLLLWMLATILLVLILTSALVLRHESGFLRDELRTRARGLAATLASTASEDGNPARVPLGGFTELRSATVRGPDGRVIWRFGPPEALPEGGRAGLVVVRERSTGGEAAPFEAEVALSTTRIRWHLLTSGLRLIIGLSVALAAALILAAVVADRITRPLEKLASRMVAFQPDAPAKEAPPLTGTREITELAEAFEHMARRLTDQRRELMEAVATLAGGVAHDFNNLLTGILLHARLLQHGRGGEEELAAIRRLAEEGVDVVGELLLFAKRESTPPRVVDLGALVRAQQPVLQHLVPDGVALMFSAADETLPVTGTPVALRRLLLNLVLNARDAVEAPRGRVEVTVGRSAGHAVIRVRDNGSGIPADLRDHLFEPFFTQRREGRGSGLGLAVVYAIVRQHSGEIAVDSAPGEGTCISVQLPLSPSDEESETDEGQGTGAVRGLLVEADGRRAAARMEMLAEAGVEARHAPAVSEAETLLARWQPDLLLVVEAGLPQDQLEQLAERGLPTLIVTGDGAGAAEGVPGEHGGAGKLRLRSPWPGDAAALRRLLAGLGSES